MPGSPAPFVLFGPAHVGALLVTALVATAGAFVVRRDPRGISGRIVSVGIAGLAFGALVLGLVFDARAGVPWTRWAPFQLCDLSSLLAVDALVFRRRASAEMLWFWGIAGSLQALLTPDVFRTWPDPVFLFYFAQHGADVAAAIIATIGLRLTPRRHGPWRAFGWTVAWASLMGVVDAVGPANFLYLRAKPTSHTILDWFGPWPLYLVGAAGIAIALYWILYLPFARAGLSGASPPADRPRART